MSVMGWVSYLSSASWNRLWTLTLSQVTLRGSFAVGDCVPSRGMRWCGMAWLSHLCSQHSP